jgi:hypothetical protein
MAQALAIAGTAVKGIGTILSSRAEAKALKGQATQLDAQALTEQASSQREAIEERRTARFAQSRALALAAAGGTSASDGDIEKIISDIAGEGEYRALTALYNGDEQADSLRAQAKARRKEAKNVKIAGLISGVGTILGGADGLGTSSAKSGASVGRKTSSSLVDPRRYGGGIDWRVDY